MGFRNKTHNSRRFQPYLRGVSSSANVSPSQPTAGIRNKTHNSRRFRPHRRSVSSSTSVSALQPTARPTFLNTFNRDFHYPIFSAFCDHLSIAEIVALTRTCRKFRNLYQYLLPIKWNVNKALRRYFVDPCGFRSQMARHNVLIWGHFVTQYFLRNLRESEPLPLVVSQGAGYKLFRKYLEDVAGYTVQVDSFTREEGNGVVVMNHPDSKTAVHLFVMTCEPIEYVLYVSGTTAAFSFMSWNKAYSVFALPTFIQNKSYLLSNWDETTRITAQMDGVQGWNVKEVMWPEEKRFNHPVRSRRRIGDRHTWTIPFDTKQVEWSKTPDYVLEYACFNMAKATSGADNRPDTSQQSSVRHYAVGGVCMRSWVWKYKYMISDELMGAFFMDRLHRSLTLEFHKLAPSQRPLRYDEFMRSNTDEALLEGFVRPANWTYQDNEFPAWYKAFEEYCQAQQK